MKNFIYLVTENKYLQSNLRLNLEKIEIQKLLVGEEIKFVGELNKVLDTKPNFEQHLKEKMDCIYKSQDFLNNLQNNNSEITKLFLNSYTNLENILEKNYKQNYEKSFTEISRKLFRNFYKNQSFTEIINDSNFLLNTINPESESFFDKEKLNKIFTDYNSYKFFIILKKLLCDDNKNLLVEYSYIYRKMQQSKLINEFVSESDFRINFLDSYCDDVKFDKLKTLDNAKSKHRNIIYDLVWKQNHPYLG